MPRFDDLDVSIVGEALRPGGALKLSAAVLHDCLKAPSASWLLAMVSVMTARAFLVVLMWSSLSLARSGSCNRTRTR